MSDAITLGAAIFVAVKPILKIYLILAVGFALVKANMLTTETSRGISNMVVNALSPCLFFNKVVTNLSGGKIKEIAIFVLSGVVIFGTGFALAVVASLVTPVPQKWKFGLLFAGIFSNISDLPIAYVQSMDTGLVFTAAEGDKAVALTCILNAVQQFMMMNLGMFQIIGLDFKDQKDDKEKNPSINDGSVESKSSNTNELQVEREESPAESDIIVNDDDDDTEDDDLDNGLDDDEAIESESEDEDEYNVIPLVTNGSEHTPPPPAPPQDIPLPEYEPNNRRVSIAASQSSSASRRTNTRNRPRRRRSRAISGASSSSAFARVRSNDSGYSSRSHRSRNQNIQTIIEEYSEAERIRTIGTMDQLAKTLSVTQEVGLNNDIDTDGDIIALHSKHPKWTHFINKYHLGWLQFVMLNMIRVPSLTLIIAFFVAMIPWVRALFVHNTIDINDAPDNLPPLNFVMDFTSYVGNAAVPMGLFLLGGTLARLEISTIPKGFWKTVLFMLVSRLVIMPILGVLWANRLYDSHWIDDSISRFLLIVSWSVPSATSQVYFTAFYTPLDGPHEQMDCYAIMLLAQYPLLVLTLPFVVTYTLKVDLGL